MAAVLLGVYRGGRRRRLLLEDRSEWPARRSGSSSTPVEAGGEGLAEIAHQAARAQHDKLLAIRLDEHYEPIAAIEVPREVLDERYPRREVSPLSRSAASPLVLARLAAVAPAS